MVLTFADLTADERREAKSLAWDYLAEYEAERNKPAGEQARKMMETYAAMAVRGLVSR